MVRSVVLVFVLVQVFACGHPTRVTQEPPRQSDATSVRDANGGTDAGQALQATHPTAPGETGHEVRPDPVEGRVTGEEPRGDGEVQIAIAIKHDGVTADWVGLFLDEAGKPIAGTGFQVVMVRGRQVLARIKVAKLPSKVVRLYDGKDRRNADERMTSKTAP